MADLDLKATIELLIKGGQLPKETGEKLRHLADEAEKAKKRTEDLHKTFGNLKSMAGQLAATFGVGMGLSELTQYLTRAYVEFAKTERQLNVVVAQTQALGGANARTKDEISDTLDAISAQYGILDDDLIPALNRAVLTFNDVGAAQKVVETAARFAANGFGTVQGNVEAITRVFQTGATRSLAEFGIVTKTVGDETIDASTALELWLQKAESLPSRMNDAQARVDRWRILMDNLSDASGKALDGFLEDIDKLRGTGGPWSGFAEWLLGDRKPKAAIDDGTGGVGKTQGPEEDPSAALKRVFAEQAKARADAQAKEDAKAAAAKAAKAKEQHDKEGQEALDARARTHEKLRDAEAKFHEELGKRADEYNAARFESDEAAFEEAQRALDELKLMAAEALNQELLDTNIRAAIAQDEELERLRVEALEKEKADKIAAVTAGSEAALAIERYYNALITGVHAEHTKKRIKWAEMERRQKLELAASVLQDTATILSALWGKNKKMAVAAAIIDNIGAAIKAFYNGGGWPWGLIPMAASLATGYAQIASMKSVSDSSTGAGSSTSAGSGPVSSGASVAAGKGFDDPANDRIAYLGGRRWASDKVRLFDQGANAGYNDAMARASVPVGSAPLAPVGGTVNIDLRGAVIADRRSERRLVRRLAAAVERDRSKRVG